MDDTLRALVLRHGQTIMNAEDELKGTLDPPLDDVGLLQAQKAADFLKGYDIQAIWSSPMLRAVRTAQTASGVLGGLRINQDRCLMPWAFGTDFLGKPKKDSGLEYYVENPAEEPPNGESLDSVITRVGDFFEKKLSIPSLTLYVCHNSVIVTLSDLIAGTAGSHPETGDVVEPGGVCAVYVDGKNYRVEPVFGQIKKAGYA